MNFRSQKTQHQCTEHLRCWISTRTSQSTNRLIYGLLGVFYSSCAFLNIRSKTRPNYESSMPTIPFQKMTRNIQYYTTLLVSGRRYFITMSCELYSMFVAKFYNTYVTIVCNMHRLLAYMENLVNLVRLLDVFWKQLCCVGIIMFTTITKMFSLKFV